MLKPSVYRIQKNTLQKNLFFFNGTEKNIYGGLNGNLKTGQAGDHGRA